MSLKLKFYVYFVILLALGFLIATFNRIENIDIFGVVFFTILSIVVESLVITTPGSRTLSMGFVVSLAALLLFKVPEVVWITSMGMMFRVYRSNGSRVHILNNPPERTLFNGANIVLSTGIAGLLYESLGGTPGTISLREIIMPIILSIIAYILTNAIIISILMSLLNNKSFFSYCYNNIIWVVRNYIALAPISILMAILYLDYGAVGALLFLGPLLLARYSFKLYIDMKNIYIETVKALSHAVEAKDPYTQGHSMRVSQYSVDIASILGFSQSRIDNLRIAAILHDIGKIGVEENILNKKDKLTDDEFYKIKQHPSIGVKIIHEIDFLKDAAEIILSHHERIDGKGYPNGKKGSEIHTEACILSVADVYDALTSDRPYRRSLEKEQALEILEQGKGSQFDALIVETFVKMIKEREGLTENVG